MELQRKTKSNFVFEYHWDHQKWSEFETKLDQRSSRYANSGYSGHNWNSQPVATNDNTFVKVVLVEISEPRETELIAFANKNKKKSVVSE